MLPEINLCLEFLFKALKDLDAFLADADVGLGGELLPDTPDAQAGGTGGQLILLQQDHIAAAQLGQVIGRAGPHHPTADDDYLSAVFEHLLAHPHPSAHLLAKGIQVAKIALDDLINTLIVHFPIEMHKQVAEAGHLLKAFGQVWPDYLKVSQNSKTICVVLWSSAPSSGHDMVAQINGCLCSHNQ